MTQGPILFDLDPDTPAPSPAEAAPVDTPTPPATMQRVAALAGRRPSALARWFWGLLGALISFWISLQVYDFVAGLMARHPILAAIGTGLLALFVVVVAIIILREVAALGRLRRIDGLQRKTAAALADGGLEPARAATQELLRFYRDSPQGLDRMRRAVEDEVDGATLLEQAEAELIDPRDLRAMAEIEASARQVAVVTAVVPLAFADVIAALGANLRMIRRISEIYGGRSGSLGSWRLTRTVFGHLVATGAVAVGDDLISSVAGGGVLSKLSRRFGEGVINGALTARVGVAAMEVCRPMPYIRSEKPSVSAITGRALTGVFGRL